MTLNKNIAHWIIIKSSGREIQAIGGDKGLSATIMSNPQLGPRTTLFNKENWTSVPEPLKGLYTLKEYRQYLILHEFGHALASIEHPENKSLRHGSSAPIMYQHTKGLTVKNHLGTQITLKKNLWPLLEERKFFHKHRVY